MNKQMNTTKIISSLVIAMVAGSLTVGPGVANETTAGAAPLKKSVQNKKAAHKTISANRHGVAPAKELTEDQAIDAVSKLPEVKKWSKLLSSTKGAGNPGYMADRDGANWVVQVFESKADQNVTFGYYDVNARTGAVKKEQP